MTCSCWGATGSRQESRQDSKQLELAVVFAAGGVSCIKKHVCFLQPKHLCSELPQTPNQINTHTQNHNWNLNWIHGRFVNESWSSLLLKHPRLEIQLNYVQTIDPRTYNDVYPLEPLLAFRNWNLPTRKIKCLALLSLTFNSFVYLFLPPIIRIHTNGRTFGKSLRGKDVGWSYHPKVTAVTISISRLSYLFPSQKYFGQKYFFCFLFLAKPYAGFKNWAKDTVLSETLPEPWGGERAPSERFQSQLGRPRMHWIYLPTTCLSLHKELLWATMSSSHFCPPVSSAVPPQWAFVGFPWPIRSLLPLPFLAFLTPTYLIST